MTRVYFILIILFMNGLLSNAFSQTVVNDSLSHDTLEGSYKYWDKVIHLNSKNSHTVILYFNEKDTVTARNIYAIDCYVSSSVNGSFELSFLSANNEWSESFVIDYSDSKREYNTNLLSVKSTENFDSKRIICLKIKNNSSTDLFIDKLLFPYSKTKKVSLGTVDKAFLESMKRMESVKKLGEIYQNSSSEEYRKPPPFNN